MLALATIAVLLQFPSPELPVGSNIHFRRSIIAIERKLEKGDFAGAQKSLARMPRESVRIQLETKGLPESKRMYLERVKNGLADTWEGTVTKVRLQWVEQYADIKVSFTSSLPPNPDSVGPAGAVFLPSDDPKDPRIEAIIALMRTEKRNEIQAIDIQNEISYAIGLFLGLERLPGGGNVMSRRDTPYTIPNQVAQANVVTMNLNMRAVVALKKAATEKKKVKPTMPEIFISPTKLESKPVLQGEPLEFSMQVSNRGNATLSFMVLPDCSCFRISHPPKIAPGATSMVRVLVDTSEFPGPFNKELFVYSNDPEGDVRRIPVTTTVLPRFRFLRELPGNVIITDGTDAVKFDVFLSLGNNPMTLKSVKVAGMPALVAFEPWQGKLPDAELGEGAIDRKGYKISVALGGSLPPGRVPITLNLETSDGVFPLITHTIFLQSGIAALPADVYLGQLNNTPAHTGTILSRPQIGFKITKITCDVPQIQATAEAIRGDWEYRLNIDYNGKAEPGVLSGTIKIHTNDPKQPIVEVRIRGIVR